MVEEAGESTMAVVLAAIGTNFNDEKPKDDIHHEKCIDMQHLVFYPLREGIIWVVSSVIELGHHIINVPVCSD
jgi:hypothetical protein